MRKILKAQSIYLSNKPGFVALMSVMIVSAIVLSISVSIVFLNINSGKSSLDINDMDQARNLASSCSEKALLEIASASGVTSETLNFPEGTCFYQIYNLGAEDRRVESRANVKNIVRREELLIDQINPEINIVYWQEVVDGF